MIKGVFKSPIKIIGDKEPLSCCLCLQADMYFGCSHNCTYCYAKSLKKRFGQPQNIIKPADITTLKNIFEKAFEKKSNDKLSKILQRKMPFRGASKTDNFQSVERKFGITKVFLELLLKYNYPCVFNTKGTLCAEEPYITLLEELAKMGLVIVQFTLISLDEKLLKKIEPGAPTPKQRLDALKELAERGIPTQIRISPFIPFGVNDWRELVLEAKKVGVKSILTEFLRIPAPKSLDKEGFNKSFFEATGINLWEKYKEEGAKVSGYLRYPPEKKFKQYREMKKFVEGQGMNFFVCSEEDPSINDKPIACANCCGTDFYPEFKNYNTATFNNIFKELKEKGKITLKDITDKYWPIKPELLEDQWKKGYFEEILVDTKKEIENGEVVYVYTRKNER